MDQSAQTLIAALTEKYQAVRALSDWSTLKTATAIEQVNALLDKRAALLSEIAALPSLSSIDLSALPSSLKDKYTALVTLIREITEKDQWMMDKINGRMNEIREELKAKSLFRNRALPGYMRQKFALV
ncbi:MAG: hypothetical protein V1913_07865 [Fibrobacterota bacterium]